MRHGRNNKKNIRNISVIARGKARPKIGGWVGPTASLDGCEKSRPNRDFLYSLVLCSYFICTCVFVLIVLHFAFMCLRTTHTTQKHSRPGGIQTRNPSKRSTADPRLRSLGHWDRLLSIPGPSSPLRVAIPTELSRPQFKSTSLILFSHLCLGIPSFLFPSDFPIKILQVHVCVCVCVCVYHSLLYNGYRVSFPGVKRPGRDVNHPPPSSAEVKERVELYLYSPLWASMVSSRAKVTFI
jgi:hypothetical protein